MTIAKEFNFDTSKKYNTNEYRKVALLKEREAIEERKIQLVAKDSDPTELARIVWDKDQKKPVKVNRDQAHVNKVAAQYNKLLTRVTKEVAFFLKTDVDDRSEATLRKGKLALATIKDLVNVIKSMKELKNTLSDEHEANPIQSVQDEELLALTEAKEALAMVGYGVTPNLPQGQNIKRL